MVKIAILVTTLAIEWTFSFCVGFLLLFFFMINKGFPTFQLVPLLRLRPPGEEDSGLGMHVYVVMALFLELHGNQSAHGHLNGCTK